MKKTIILISYILLILGVLGSVILKEIQTLARDLKVSIFDAIAPLPSELAENGDIYFLLLGIGGGDHDGPTLSDSITVARLDLLNNKLHTLGLPRDIWHDGIKDKINSIYAYSLNDNHKNNSFAYTKDHFSSLLGIRIDSMLVLDFATFEAIIDEIDGIDITLDKGFVDPWFPKKGSENQECEPYDADYKCRYVTLTFPKGTYKINGETALNFVRSRHAEGDAGSDFSRSNRQQIVLSSIKNKIYEIIKRRDLKKLSNIAKILDSQIVRDRENAKYIPLVRHMLLAKNKFSISSHTFTADYFEVPIYDDYDGKYVLIPKGGDFERFKTDVQKLLTK